mgnify:FL=1|jgi:hypothetical protein
MSNVTYVLPSGLKVTLSGVPENVTDSEIQDELIAQGKASLSDFQKPQTAPVQESSMLESVGGFLKSNMEIPVGLAGSFAGMAAGAPLGPVGMVVGGIIGGASGSAGGSLMSDVFEGEELDFADATNEFLMSAGFDVATLGLGKVLKPSYFAAKAALGFTPKEVAEDLIKTARQGTDAGSLESLRASQNILQQKGASLTRFQTGQATALDVLSERFANAGLLSGQATAENAVKVNQAVKDSLNDIANKVDYSLGDSPDKLGEAMFDIISAGRKALSDNYGAGLDTITASVKNNRVNTTDLKKQLSKFLQDNSEVTTGTVLKNGVEVQAKKRISMLDPDTVNYVNQLLKGPLELGNMSADALLKLDKQISTQIRNFGDINSKNYNTVADRELGELTDILKDSFINILKQADPKAANEYAALKSAYKEGRTGLLPDINKNFIKSAEKTNYDQLGKMLVDQTNVSKINNFMKSIDNAYAQIAKSGEGVADIGYATAADARQAVKQSFLKNLMPNLQQEAFNIEDYARLASQFSKPAQAARLKAIVGEDYNQVKQLFNLMSEASKKPESNFGTLMLRAKEYGAVSTGASFLAGAGVYAGGPVAVLSAATILTAPVVLAKMSHNPKAVNKLLAFEKTKFKSDALREKAATFLVSDFIDNLSTEEQAEVRNYFRGE